VTKKEAVVNRYAELGDENVTVPDQRWTRITIRKGRVFTEVDAFSEETAETIGRLVAEAIPSKN
jgi:hypothetical protein